MIYVFPMFGAVCKKVAFFEINCENCQFKFASFYVQGQPGLKVEIRDHPQTCFDATNPMVTSDLENELLLKIMFFEVSSIVSIYVKFQ